MKTLSNHRGRLETPRSTTDHEIERSSHTHKDADRQEDGAETDEPIDPVADQPPEPDSGQQGTDRRPGLVRDQARPVRAAWRSVTGRPIGVPGRASSTVITLPSATGLLPALLRIRLGFVHVFRVSRRESSRARKSAGS